MNAQRFEIEVADSDLGDLRRRLATSRLPADLENEDWRYGVSSAYLASLMNAWRDDYRWRAHERAMNAYEHFRVELGGQQIHYLHVRRPGALPLLLIGGWPQTFWDFAEVLPLLGAFELVVPDLPGQGFSSPLARSGIGLVQASEMFHHLMTDVLGHSHYGVYGTDWGALIGEHLAVTQPDAVLGLHTTMPMPLDFSPGKREREQTWTDDESVRRETVRRQAETGSGYLNMHVTRPQTVAFLSDSPAAMAAWIVDKVYQWSDHHGDLEQAYPRDRLLTLLSIFWLTDTLGSSCRFYAESIRHAWISTDDRRPLITVPTAIAAYPKESGAYPRRWVESYFNVLRYTVMDRGGHFPAVESPQTLGSDIGAFFQTIDRGGRP